MERFFASFIIGTYVILPVLVIACCVYAHFLDKTYSGIIAARRRAKGLTVAEMIYYLKDDAYYPGIEPEDYPAIVGALLEIHALYMKVYSFPHLLIFAYWKKQWLDRKENTYQGYDLLLTERAFIQRLQNATL